MHFASHERYGGSNTDLGRNTGRVRLWGSLLDEYSEVFRVWLDAGSAGICTSRGKRAEDSPSSAAPPAPRPPFASTSSRPPLPRSRELILACIEHVLGSIDFRTAGIGRLGGYIVPAFEEIQRLFVLGILPHPTAHLSRPHHATTRVRAPKL
jgi:hypothetical protein